MAQPEVQADNPKACSPSPAEIAAACAEIRRGWDPQTELSRRAVGRKIDWQIPGLNAGHCVADNDAVRTFMGTGAMLSEADDWKRTEKPGDPEPPMPFDD